MRFRLTWLAALIGLATFVQVALAQQATPAAPAPDQPNEARNRIQSALLGMISSMPDAVFLKNGVDPTDVSRAKTCAVQAIVADIPDNDAKHIVEQMYHDPPLRDEVVDRWVLSSFSKGSERRLQIMKQVKKLCPEFEAAFAS
jgi:hypothetical protein